MTEANAAGAQGIRLESRKLKRELTLLPLFGLIYFTVCGGSFGVEPLVGLSGPGLALILIVVTPIIFSIPNMLMVREMNSMMPVEGGYYHWVKVAFGPFAGFMAGWMNWVVSWVDVSIYPVLAAYYLGYFFPALRNGTVLFGMEISGGFLSWMLGLVLIWTIIGLNIRGARTAGITTNWVGVLMILPLLFLSVMGIAQWIRGGETVALPILHEGDSLFSAFSVGLFVVMWNFMGWELPSAAGGEIVNPKRTYPLAMALALIAAIATYALPTVAGLYGGAGDDGRYLLWGQEELAEGEGIALALTDYGISEGQLAAWNVDPSSAVGWEFPEIAHAVGEKISGSANSLLASVMGSTVSFAAVLSMIGLFIANSLAGTRVPFAMAEDGMMPRFLVKVHDRYGTPWVAILVCGVLYSIFSLQAFAFLVVVDVFLNLVVLMVQFLALWKLRVQMPHLPRARVPGGYWGLALVTIGPFAMIALAIFSQVYEEGLSSLWLAFAAILAGALLYLPIRRYVKPGIPDVNPFVDGDE
jgi:amino acid transporter